MKILSVTLIALLLAAPPLAVHARQAGQPASEAAPAPYGPKLYDTPEEEAAAMRKAAQRAEALRVEAGKKQGLKKLAPRRPVRQQLNTLPPSSGSTSSYRPLPVPIPGPGVTPMVPSTPVPVHCVGATCIRADGVTMPVPVGSTTVDAQGRTCHQHGNFVQCF